MKFPKNSLKNIASYSSGLFCRTLASMLMIASMQLSAQHETDVPCENTNYTETGYSDQQPQLRFSVNPGNFNRPTAHNGVIVKSTAPLQITPRGENGFYLGDYDFKITVKGAFKLYKLNEETGRFEPDPALRKARILLQESFNPLSTNWFEGTYTSNQELVFYQIGMNSHSQSIVDYYQLDYIECSLEAAEAYCPNKKIVITKRYDIQKLDDQYFYKLLEAPLRLPLVENVRPLNPMNVPERARPSRTKAKQTSTERSIRTQGRRVQLRIEKTEPRIHQPLTIYPNPAGTQSTLHMQHIDQSVRLVNSAGQEVWQATTATGEIVTDLSIFKLSPGLYYILSGQQRLPLVIE